MVCVETGSPGQKRPTPRTKTVIECLAKFADVGTVHESSLSQKSWTYVVVGSLEIQMRGIVCGIRFVGRTCLVTAIEVLGRTHYSLKSSRPTRREFQPCVQASNAVELARARQLPVGIDCANTGLLQNVTTHPGDGECGAVPREWTAVRHAVSRSPIIRG